MPEGQRNDGVISERAFEGPGDRYGGGIREPGGRRRLAAGRAQALFLPATTPNALRPRPGRRADRARRDGVRAFRQRRATPTANATQRPSKPLIITRRAALFACPGCGRCAGTCSWRFRMASNEASVSALGRSPVACSTPSPATSKEEITPGPLKTSHRREGYWLDGHPSPGKAGIPGPMPARGLTPVWWTGEYYRSSDLMWILLFEA